MPTERIEKNRASERSIKKDRRRPGHRSRDMKEVPSRRLTDVIGKDNVIAAWLASRKDGDPEVFIALAENLSDFDRSALAGHTDLTLNVADDLLEKLAGLEAENEHLKSLSLTDDLTGLYNYRYFARQLENEILMSRRTGRPFTLMMIDIDDFKRINDTIGHNEANNVMVGISEAIKNRTRHTDIGCRYGGDEFAVIVPATYLADALNIARRLRDALGSIFWQKGEAVTASIGMAEYNPESGQDFEQFVNYADKALYKAKAGGKDRIFYFDAVQRISEKDMVSNEEKGALLKLMNSLE